jgi:hypothetical protein
MSDGIDVFKAACREMGISVMDLIVRTSRWADPTVVRVLPVWYPAFYRGMPLYKADWKTPQLLNGKEQRRESNERAHWTIHTAVGGKKSNWTCCHIWGYSDPTFQVKGGPTYNPRYYTCLPNLVLLPTPVKTLTDSMPEVQQAPRVCSWYVFGWTPDPADAPEAELVRSGWVPEHYPSAWPRKHGANTPTGLVQATPSILEKTRRRKAEIADELRRADAGELPNYPANRVRQVLLAWASQPLEVSPSLSD